MGCGASLFHPFICSTIALASGVCQALLWQQRDEESDKPSPCPTRATPMDTTALALGGMSHTGKPLGNALVRAGRVVSGGSECSLGCEQECVFSEPRLPHLQWGWSWSLSCGVGQSVREVLCLGLAGGL